MKKEAVWSLLIPLKMFENKAHHLNEDDISIIATLLGSLVTTLPQEQTHLLTAINEVQ